MLAGMRLSHPLHQLLIESCGATVQDDFWCQISSVGSPVMFKNLGLFFWIFKNIPHKIRISHSSRERFSAFVISEKSEFPNFRLSYSNRPKCTDSVNFRCTGVLTLVQNRSPHTQTYIRIKYKPQQIWKKNSISMKPSITRYNLKAPVVYERNQVQWCKELRFLPVKHFRVKRLLVL